MAMRLLASPRTTAIVRRFFQEEPSAISRRQRLRTLAIVPRAVLMEETVDPEQSYCPTTNQKYQNSSLPSRLLPIFISPILTSRPAWVWIVGIRQSVGSQRHKCGPRNTQKDAHRDERGIKEGLIGACRLPHAPRPSVHQSWDFAPPAATLLSPRSFPTSLASSSHATPALVSCEQSISLGGKIGPSQWRNGGRSSRCVVGLWLVRRSIYSPVAAS